MAPQHDVTELQEAGQRGSCSIHGARHPGYENWSGSDQGLPVSPIVLDDLDD